MIKKFDCVIQDGDATKEEINLFIEIDEKNEVVEFFKEKENSRDQEFLGFIDLNEFIDFLDELKS